MSGFSRKIEPYVSQEILLSQQCRFNGDVGAEFRHLENAHVLGQESTYQHVRVHCLMFLWGLRQKDVGQTCGQILRVVGAITKTMIGLVPQGNTGGSNISPFKKLPVAPEFSRIIERAKAKD